MGSVNVGSLLQNLTYIIICVSLCQVMVCIVLLLQYNNRSNISK